MTDELPEMRKSHPYVMYDMMKEIPKGMEATIKTMDRVDYGFLKEPLYLTGNGTAFHSAVVGTQILKRTDKKFFQIQAFELEKYHEPSGVVIGVSHTGKTKSTVDALKKARKTAFTVGITHYDKSPITENSDLPIVIGDSPDASLCNTKTFFDNAVACLKIAEKYGKIDLDFDQVFEGISKLVTKSDNEIKAISKELDSIDDIFVLGAGPNFVTAREAAQKIKESTHVHAEGIELEEFNHGCTAVVDENSLIVIIQTPTAAERSADIVRAAKTVGTKTIVINGEGDYSVEVPELDDEYLSPFLNMVPLYYLAYYMSVNRGLNPDYLRFEDEKYLKFDQIIFPPGAH